MVTFASLKMKKFAFYSLTVLLFTACISKKKYNELQNRHNQALNEKSGVEEVLTKVAVENDSLKKRNNFLDSMYRSDHEKLASLSNKSVPAAPARSKAASMPKNVEYEKKALYVYNLPNYVFWPRGIKTDKFLVGIMGESALKSALASNLYGKKINDLPAIVEPYSPASGKFYHMIFVAESKQKEFYKLKKELKDQAVLLITENAYLEKAGAHICFYIDGDKVRFKVNKKGIEKCGMNVSEQLIKFSNEN